MPSTSTPSTHAASRFPWLAVGALLGSLLCLCVGTSFAKHLFPLVGATGTSTYRLGFAMLLLMAFWRPWRRRWHASDVRPLLQFGLSLGVMNLLFYSALQTIPFGLALAIEFTGPLAVALWSSRRALDIVWVALVTVGLGLILPWPGSTQALDPLGLAYAIGASVCWALYIVFGKRVAAAYGGFATPMGVLVAALVVAPVGMYTAGAALLNPTLLLAGLGVAFVSSALPYTLEMYALKHLPRQTFSILLSMEPIIGALAGWLLLSETLTAVQIGAMVLIIVASIGSASTANH